MTSARVFYALTCTIMATGVATTFVPAIRDLVATGWIVAGVLAVLVAVAKYVADEIRWNREMDAVINAPATPVATPELVAK
ncbi:MAG: hypothetical protein H0V92_05735 [Pseudonocardiales bacterium]|nr:hypothetical protein [Pseudonocardiales bacterium]